MKFSHFFIKFFYLLSVIILIFFIKEKLVDMERRIQAEIEYSLDEIEIRIESLKMEFDNLCDRLLNEIDEIRETFIKFVSVLEE